MSIDRMVRRRSHAGISKAVTTIQTIIIIAIVIVAIGGVFLFTRRDNTPPVAILRANSTEVEEDNPIQFYAGDSSDNVGIESYSWNFGDGTTGTGEDIVHTYSEAGNFTVTLTVADKGGNEDEETTTIEVHVFSQMREILLDSFEVVWQTMNDSYFDPTFGGLDWNEVHDRYRPMIFSAKSDEEFYRFVNEMLFELNVSHMGVSPPSVDVSPVYTIGIDVRLLEGAAVITSVDPGSSGEKAGLRPGFVIKSIDGITIEQIAEKAEQNPQPPFNEHYKRTYLTYWILGHIYGPPDTMVSIVHLDENDEAHEVSIARESEVIQEDFESKRLSNGIGYIHFNAWNTFLEYYILDSIESMRDAPGLIIDLRGNPGGDLSFRLIANLVKERKPFLELLYRRVTDSVFNYPADSVYEGPVVVLMDIMSGSASESFAAGMQSIGRAVIVGGRSMGACMHTLGGPRLPNGADFYYPHAQIATPDGTVIEGRGVVPDIEVALDRTSLLQGRDTQLEEAIKYIENEIQG